MLRTLVAGVLALALPLAASAAGVVESLKGSARAGEAALAQGQKFTAPGAVSTGPGSQVTLKFDDGTQIVLGENSLLRVLDFRRTESGVSDRALFELLRGGARVVTGQIAAENPKQFFFRVPQTQLMVEHPADFTVVLINPAYIAVHAGSLISNNAWGTTTLRADSTTMVAGSSSAPAAIAPSAMPGTAAASMKSLQVASVGQPAGGGGAAGVGATEAGTAGVSFGTTAVLVTIGIAAIAVAKESDNEPAVPTTTHH
ncbi:MAG TPA: FecR domain-containing protein [Burkholderiales bacterium]|nr:FecR domain-containing protein [Burkholderiales bacterium]